MTSPTDETRRSYDAVAERYAAELSDELDGKPIDRALLDALVDLAPDGVVADLGAGPGQIGAYVAGRRRAVLAIDLSPHMCAIARRTGLAAAAGDMAALPLRDEALAAITCFYAVIHLDAAARAQAYAEFARVLRPNGHALIAFHTEDAGNAMGQSLVLHELMGSDVELTFHYLDPDDEIRQLRSAGFTFVARLDRAPRDGLEHASQRSYLLVRKSAVHFMQPT